MSILSQIKKSTAEAAPRVILCGQIGIGKTNFGSSAPSPLFICSEKGLTGLEGIQHINVTTFDEVIAIIESLTVEDHAYQTVVFDTVDWLEKLIHAHMVKRDKMKDIEAYGWKKGYISSVFELDNLLAKIETLREKKNMIVIMLAHVHIKAFTSPDGVAWDRYEMKGYKDFVGKLNEWADACLFASHDVFKTKDKEGTEKALSGGRIVNTEWSPAWEAKNRYDLPPRIDFPIDSGWEVLAKEIEAGQQRQRERKTQCAVLESNLNARRARYSELLKTAVLEPADLEKHRKFESGKLKRSDLETVERGISFLEKKQAA